ncbi:MAG: hypothetical protein F4065_04000 [Rhodothermaceae bacterium]|nr:hypothetical protein [Rhodothermaceae bacterium]MYG43851.1 hypothetical protein [Rhodothermaceae bacterium]MYH12385.1 hypothetical protein [Rhodothermaceae bacterium]MYJ49555.1 hypothetical protein [Rhodothermaceae bacterium]
MRCRRADEGQKRDHVRVVSAGTGSISRRRIAPGHTSSTEGGTLPDNKFKEHLSGGVRHQKSGITYHRNG